MSRNKLKEETSMSNTLHLHCIKRREKYYDHQRIPIYGKLFNWGNILEKRLFHLNLGKRSIPILFNVHYWKQIELCSNVIRNLFGENYLVGKACVGIIGTTLPND